MEEEIFIRKDLDKTSTGNTAYYRLDADMRDFLNKCSEENEIEAFILTRENDKYTWNIGIVLKDIN